jgi:hypothetical protein
VITDARRVKTQSILRNLGWTLITEHPKDSPAHETFRDHHVPPDHGNAQVGLPDADHDPGNPQGQLPDADHDSGNPQGQLPDADHDPGNPQARLPDADHDPGNPHGQPPDADHDPGNPQAGSRTPAMITETRGAELRALPEEFGERGGVEDRELGDGAGEGHVEALEAAGLGGGHGGGLDDDDVVVFQAFGEPDRDDGELAGLDLQGSPASLPAVSCTQPVADDAASLSVGVGRVAVVEESGVAGMYVV